MSRLGPASDMKKPGTKHVRSVSLALDLDGGCQNTLPQLSLAHYSGLSDTHLTHPASAQDIFVGYVNISQEYAPVRLVLYRSIHFAC